MFLPSFFFRQPKERPLETSLASTHALANALSLSLSPFLFHTNTQPTNHHSAEFEGFSSDETVRVVMSGSQEPRSVDITEEAHSQGAERLSALVTEAMKDAHAKSVDGMKVRMSEMAKSLGLGGPGGGLGL